MLVLEESVRTHRGPIQLQNKWCCGCTSIVHVARWFFAFPIKAHVFSFLLGQIVQGEPGLLCCGRNAAASATRRCICSVEFFAGFCSKVRLQQRSKLVTSRTSRAPFTRHRLLGGKVAAAVWDTSRLTNASRREGWRMPTLPQNAA